MSINLFHFRLPPTSLSPEVRYEKILNLFGLEGYLVRTIPELEQALEKSLKVNTCNFASTFRQQQLKLYDLCLQVQDAPSIINVLIDPSSSRKSQKFNWLTESKL